MAIITGLKWNAVHNVTQIYLQIMNEVIKQLPSCLKNEG